MYLHPAWGYVESSLRVCSSYRCSVFIPPYSQLELGENRITSGLQSLQGSPKLAHLSLSNNRIKDLETLEPLVSTNFLSNRVRMRRVHSIDQLLNWNHYRIEWDRSFLSFGYLRPGYFQVVLMCCVSFSLRQSILQNLKSLDLLNCEVTTIEGYRAEIFKMIPSLKYLDGYDR